MIKEKNKILVKSRKSTSQKGGKIRVGLAIILFVFLVMFIFVEYVKYEDLRPLFINVEKDYHKTIGRIIDIQRLDYPSSTRQGSSIRAKFKIDYAYNVNGKELVKTELIDFMPDNQENLDVYYKIENPQKSFIILE